MPPGPTASYSKAMRVVWLPDRETKASFEVCGEDRAFTDDEFFEFCVKNSDLRMERLANGKIVITRQRRLRPHRNNGISAYLFLGAESEGRGVAFDSHAEFIRDSGAAFAGASSILKSRLARFTKKEKRKLGRICPDFGIELRSTSDRLPSLKAKMDEWDPQRRPDSAGSSTSINARFHLPPRHAGRGVVRSKHHRKGSPRRRFSA